MRGCIIVVSATQVLLWPLKQTTLPSSSYNHKTLTILRTLARGNRMHAWISVNGHVNIILYMK